MMNRDVLLRATRWPMLGVCLGLVMAVMVASGPSARAADDTGSFFDVPPAALGDRDPAGVFPRGQRFPFTWYGIGANRVKSHGATLAGNMYNISADRMAQAVEHDVQVVARISGGWKKDELANVTDEEIRQVIGDKVREMLAWPGQERIAWWYLTPEELRYWRKHEINYLKVATETIRQTDPLKRPIWMYDPGHRSAEGLTPTAAHLEIVGKGIYTNYSGQMNDRVWVRWSLQQQKLAMAKSEHAVASIAVPEMFEHPGKHDPALLEDEARAVELIRAWVRHDVYAALLEGAQGVAVFAVTSRPRNTPPFTGQIFRAYMDTYQQVAHELTGEQDLGRAFLFGERRQDLQVQVVDGPPTVSLTFMKNPTQTFPSVGHADIAWNGARYLFLVNSAPTAVRVRVTGFPQAQADFHALMDDTHHLAAGRRDGFVELSFEPWQVRAYRITQAGKGQ